jgi:predicted membrane-bound spermidine synthase
MRILLCFVFFLSGVAGLIFEALWFRMAGLTFGNSVWASSLVLSSFMGGLALGNALTARHGFRIHQPIRFYARIEILVGIFGCGLVLLFPMFPRLFAPLFRPFLETPAVLNPLRLGLAFVILLIPTTAMGATLPVMVKALNRWRPDFGTVLGQLYGWNTLGAMTGALAAEAVLIGAFGLAGSAVVAAVLNFTAAGLALLIHRSAPTAVEGEEGAPPPLEMTPEFRRFALAAFGAGGILLALEVVWFRLLQLFVPATSHSFAVMLFVVLLGIGAGGVASAHWLKRRPDAYRLFPHLAVGAGLLVVWSYIRFEGLPASHPTPIGDNGLVTFRLAFHLMFPVSFASGILFTFLGRAAFEECGEETRAVGKIAFFNTLGAMLGAIFAGWVLLPGAGVERSLFVLAVGYLAVATLGPWKWLAAESGRRRALVLGALGASCALSLALFPFGLMRNHFIPAVVGIYGNPDTEIVEVREGLNETIIYAQERWHGEVFATRLITNAISMAADDPNGKRYMKYFVYWPLAFHPEVKKALLISYGVGQTAKALTDSAEIEDIDIVDLSAEVLDTHRVIFPEEGTSPLDDPRVDVHVEDGRFFLLTSGESYDLITAEPPPLMMAGVVNLYTQEYFQLLHERLNEGGYVTYWLPVRLIAVSDAKAVCKAFCNVFEDCSLWRGGKLELVLAGSRGAKGQVDPARFRRQWDDATVGRELEVLGLEVPELLLATFLGDSTFLEEFTAGAAPLTDNFPHRLSRAPHTEPDYYHQNVLAHVDAAERYRHSEFLKEMLPRPLRDGGLEHYEWQTMVDWALDVYLGKRPIPLEPLDRVLTQTRLRTTALWLLGEFMEPSGAVEALVARGEVDGEVAFILGLRALAERRFLEADEHFKRAQELERGGTGLENHSYRILALGYGGQLEEARALSTELAHAIGAGWEDSELGRFYAQNFGVDARGSD